jgi:hypothetical protein
MFRKAHSAWWRRFEYRSRSCCVFEDMTPRMTRAPKGLATIEDVEDEESQPPCFYIICILGQAPDIASYQPQIRFTVSCFAVRKDRWKVSEFLPQISWKISKVRR